jgi:uncharacterized membrane protein
MNVERTGAETERTVTVIAYALHLFGAVAGLPSIVGLIVNYVRVGRYGDVFDSHHRWMIRSFWWGLVWVVIGCITFWMLGLGWVILGITWIWYLYRHIRGLIALLNGEPMPR